MTTVATSAPAAEPGTAPGGRRAGRTRADALRNRERIVAAARETLVEQGPEVPFDEIARRAGIGNATLYRHFADRRALIRDVLLSVVTRTADHAETALAQVTDPFEALRAFAYVAVDERIGAMCGLIVHGTGQDDPELLAQCGRLQGAVEALMARAQRAGQVRSDVTGDDLMLSVALLTRPLPGIPCSGIDIHRHLGLFLDGLRAPVPAAYDSPTEGSGEPMH